MAKQIKATLKGYFETGKVPSQAQYADLIDSNLNLLDTTTQTIVSPVNFTSSEINLTGNLTASGNISSSGVLTAEGLVISDDAVIIDTLTVGGIFQSNGINLDGNITASGHISGSIIEGQTLTADVFLSAPSASITNLTNTNITASGNISASGTGSFGELEVTGNTTVDGDVFISQYIRHIGDTNTLINFTDNKIQLQAGGIVFLTTDKDSAEPYPFTINNGGNRINFRVMDRNSNLLLKTDSEAFKVNLYHAGNQKLETAAGGVNITGEITASGNISSSGNIIAETGSFDNGIILKAPNGNQFRFTVNNSGHLSLTGSAV